MVSEARRKRRIPTQEGEGREGGSSGKEAAGMR